MNSGAMNIHHKYILMGINYGRLRVGVADRGFPQVPGGPMTGTSKTTVKSESDVYVCACGDVVGGGGYSTSQRGEVVHTWVYLVPDDLKWNYPFNNK